MATVGAGGGAVQDTIGSIAGRQRRSTMTSRPCWPALRRGLEDKDGGKAARTAIAYVHLVYGRQFQQPKDEAPADPLDVGAMTREQRDAMKWRILAQHPHLVDELAS